MKASLKRIINNVITDSIVGALIIISIVLTVLEAMAVEGSFDFECYSCASQIVTAIFIIELFARWYVARSSRIFFITYWIDILAVIPIIRPLRILRVLRLLRLIRLGVFISRRAHRLASILHEGIAENLIILVALFVIFLIGAIGMPIVERGNPDFGSFSKSAWWSIFTLMAGEPIGGEASSTVGRLLSALLMLGGFTIFAVLTGVISAFMVTRLKGKLEAKEMELEGLSGHYLICGWNRSVEVIIRELQVEPQTRDCQIVIVAELEKEPELSAQQINTDKIFFVRGDYTSTEVLKKVGVIDAAAAILLADESRERSDRDRDARTILAALMIEKMKPGIYTTAQILHQSNREHLKIAGVEDVITADEYIGNLIAHSSRTFGLVTMMNELLTSTRGNEFYKVDLPGQLTGKTFMETITWYKERHDALPISIERETEGAQSAIITNPSAETEMLESDKLIVVARQAP